MTGHSKGTDYMPDERCPASEIAERLMHRTGAAIMSGAFDTFAECFALPYHIETVQGAQVMSSREDLYRTFVDVRGHMTRKGVTLMSRSSIAAEYRGKDQIAATHETRLMRDDELVQEPYPAFSVIKRDQDGVWRIHATSYMIPDSPGLNTALTPV